MDTLSWVTLLLAITTFALAVAAFVTIWQNHLLQKRERREKILNEIIEWAIDVSKCGLEIDVRFFNDLFKAKDIEEMNWFGSSVRLDLLSGFLVVSTRSDYVSRMACAFGENLNGATLETVEKLKEHIELLRKNYQDKGKGKATSDDIGKHRDQLTESANKVVKEATKIKTKP
jgi:hypothetical protein